jgi:DNA-binding GntR family transcriptional regulator
LTLSPNLTNKNLQKITLHEQTYNVLRDNILAGTLTAGDRIVESQLADQLQVSRTPIREAIRQLQQEGLLVTDQFGWLRIATVSLTEAHHLYDCRLALETLAVEGACENASEPQLKEIQNLIKQAEKLAKLEISKANSTLQLETDYQFHRTIAQSSGNNCLTSLLDQVFSKMALLRLQTTLRNPRVLEICTEHRKIYEAIAQRDLKLAKQEMQSHLKASKLRVIKELTNIQAKDKLD